MTGAGPHPGGPARWARRGPGMRPHPGSTASRPAGRMPVQQLDSEDRRPGNRGPRDPAPDPRWEATQRATHVGTAGPRARARGTAGDYHRQQRLSIAGRYPPPTNSDSERPIHLTWWPLGALPNLAQHGPILPNGRGPRKLIPYLGTIDNSDPHEQILQLPPRHIHLRFHLPICFTPATLS